MRFNSGLDGIYNLSVGDCVKEIVTLLTFTTADDQTIRISNTADPETGLIFYRGETYTSFPFIISQAWKVLPGPRYFEQIEEDAFNITFQNISLALFNTVKNMQSMPKLRIDILMADRIPALVHSEDVNIEEIDAFLISETIVIKFRRLTKSNDVIPCILIPPTGDYKTQTRNESCNTQTLKTKHSHPQNPRPLKSKRKKRQTKPVKNRMKS